MARFAIHFTIFLTLLGLWTWKLLEPYPVPEDLRKGLGEYDFWAAKTLHACGYALLTFLAMTLPVARRWRWALAGFLVLHGVGTEIGQTFVENRTGTVRDVIIDWCGIALGLAALRLRFLKPGEPRVSATGVRNDSSR
ncbi:MAG TPA: VanZ family protein [Urbifossiella sp.]|nr:VanZ family protein [Urbifossiella sp.]